MGGGGELIIVRDGCRMPRNYIRARNHRTKAYYSESSGEAYAASVFSLVFIHCTYVRVVEVVGGNIVLKLYVCQPSERARLLAGKKKSHVCAVRRGLYFIFFQEARSIFVRAIGFWLVSRFHI